MVKDSIDVLGLLRKRGVEGDVDFLREALGVLKLMNAVTCPWCGARTVLSTGNYTSWQECPSCHRHQLVAWASCQPELVPSRRRADSRQEAAVAR